MNNNNIPVKELAELMDMMSERVPGLLRDLQNTLFSQEGAESMSKAVGIFYKNLIEAGMDKAEALTLTQEYLSSLKFMNRQG